MIYLKQCSDSSDFAYNSAVYDQVKTGSLESQAEVEELNQSQSMGTSLVIGLSFRRGITAASICSYFFRITQYVHERTITGNHSNSGSFSEV